MAKIRTQRNTDPNPMKRVQVIASTLKECLGHMRTMAEDATRIWSNAGLSVRVEHQNNKVRIFDSAGTRILLVPVVRNVPMVQVITP